MRPKRVLAINLYYAPDLASTGQLAADICEELARRGVEVHVVAAQPCYSAGQETVPDFEIRNGVRVHRIAMGRSVGRERLATRFLGYLRFLTGAARKARSIARSERPDRVLTFHNPPFVGVIGAWVARRSGAAFTYALYDIHPDVLLATGWCRLPSPVVGAWNAVNRWILSRAEHVIVLGEGMKRTLVDTGRASERQLAIIPTWAKPEIEPVARSRALRAELGAGDGELLLLHTGNMGIMHRLDPILDAASACRDLPVRFLFVGDGAQRAALEARCAREGLDRVRFLPLQPEERFVAILAAADASFVTLRPGLERLAVPCRAYTLLAAARPLVTIMEPDADIARMVARHGCGWNVAGGEELAALLRRFVADPSALEAAGRAGRDAYLAHFRREVLVHQYVRLLAGEEYASRPDGADMEAAGRPGPAPVLPAV